MPTYDPTTFKYLEQDDEYMYFEVFELIDKEGEPLTYESKGTIYIGKVKGIDR